MTPEEQARILSVARHTAILMKLEAARVLRDLDSHIAVGYVQFIAEIDAEAIAQKAVDYEVGEFERLQYELKMETIRAEHAESDIGGVREEQWYEVRNKELEAEVERLRADLLAVAERAVRVMQEECIQAGCWLCQIGRELIDGEWHRQGSETMIGCHSRDIRALDATAIARRAVDSEVVVDHNLGEGNE